MTEAAALLSTCTWALRSTASAVTRRSLGQLARNQGAIMGAEAGMNSSNVLRAKKKQIVKHNELESKKRANHQHQVGDHIKTLRRKNLHAHLTKLSQPNEGPCPIVKVLENTVKIQRGDVREEISIARIAPYFNREQE